MKITILLLLTIALTSCSPRDEDRAKREAREAARQAETDAKKIGRQVETDAKKASREIDGDLKKTRDKINEKLDEHH